MSAGGIACDVRVVGSGDVRVGCESGGVGSNGRGVYRTVSVSLWVRAGFNSAEWERRTVSLRPFPFPFDVRFPERSHCGYYLPLRVRLVPKVIVVGIAL